MAEPAGRAFNQLLPSRGAVLSLTLHSAVLAALLLIKSEAPRISRPAVIQAVLVSLNGSGTSLDRPASEVADDATAAAAKSTPAPVPETVAANAAEANETAAAPPATPRADAAPARKADVKARQPTAKPSAELEHEPEAAPAHATASPAEAPTAQAAVGESPPAEAPSAEAPVAEARVAAEAPVTETHAAEAPSTEAPVAAADQPANAGAEAPVIAADVPADTVAASGASSSSQASSAPNAAPPPEMRPDQRTMLSKRFASLTRSFAADEPPDSVSWKSKGQEYRAEFRRQPTSDPMGTDHVLVEISTTENGTRLSTELRMKRLAFSDFAQFIDYWNPAVQMHDDEIDGRFHSNSEIRVQADRDATVVVRGIVTTASRNVNIDSTGYVSRSKLFPAGIETGVRRIVLPKRFVAFPDGSPPRGARVRRLERDARVTFYADGTYGWRYLDSAEPEQHERLGEPAEYILADRGVVLHVKGVVNGKVLVHSPKDIVIEDDLVYAVPPDAAGADDYLGLVADRSVEIAPPNVTGPGDLTIDGAIYARRDFIVRHYYSSSSGTLIIHGSLISGAIGATEPRYATKVEFDPRLAARRPPSFPLTDRYELESFSGTWTPSPK